MNKFSLIAPALAVAAAVSSATMAFAADSMMMSSSSMSSTSGMSSMSTDSMSSGSMSSGSMTTMTSMMAQGDLSYGSTGSDVVSLQTWLETNGYLTIPTGVSKGFFGPLTRAALIKYQTSAGVYASGYFGPLTRAALSAKMGMMAWSQGVMVGGALMTPNRDIVANALNANNVTTLVAAVKAAGLVSTLQGAGPFTVFAPNNGAFDKLPAGTVDTLLKTENLAQLKDILTYHVVSGRYTAADLKDGQVLTTVEGKTITINKSASGQISVNGSAMVETPDVISSNGVTFVIDSVLMPK